MSRPLMVSSTANFCSSASRSLLAPRSSARRFMSVSIAASNVPLPQARSTILCSFHTVGSDQSRIVTGVQCESGGDGGGHRPGEIRAVAGLVAHNAVEQGACVIRAHVSVGFGQALGLGCNVAQSAFQSCQFASVLNGFDGFDCWFQDRTEVAAHDLVPFPANPAHHVHVVLDRLEVAYAGEPTAIGNALVQHGGVHHKQCGDGTAVGLLTEIALFQIVQPEVPVQVLP